MTLLWSLEEALTLDAAVAALTDAIGEHTTPAWLLARAVEGKLKLAIRFGADACGRWGQRRERPQDHATEVRTGWVVGTPVPGGYHGLRVGTAINAVHLTEQEELVLEGQVSRLPAAVYDLPMLGEAVARASREIVQMNTGDPGPDLAKHSLIKANGKLCLLVEHVGDGDHPATHDQIGPVWDHPKNYRASNFPPNSEFVVRPAALMSLITTLTAAWPLPDQQRVEEVHPTSSTSLLLDSDRKVKESIPDRQARCLERLQQLGGDMILKNGKWRVAKSVDGFKHGAMAALVVEEQKAGRLGRDAKRLTKDCERAAKKKSELQPHHWPQAS